MNNQSSFIHNSKSRKQPKCPSISDWINKLWYIHPVEYYSAIKRNKLLIYTTWMNLNYYVERKKDQKRGGYILYNLIYIKFKLIHCDRKHVSCLQQRWKEG
jgi:hypothetical protein